MLLLMPLSGCHKTEAEETHHAEQRKVVITSPVEKDVVITEKYFGNIKSRRHIEVCASEVKKQQLAALNASVTSATQLFQNACAEYVEVLLA
jgi:hypothetical protein